MYGDKERAVNISTKVFSYSFGRIHSYIDLIEFMKIYIQPADVEFNRGLLKNIGFVESVNRGNFQCVVFQDIDLLPENDKNLQHCPDMPRHLVVAIDTWDYKYEANNFCINN